MKQACKRLVSLLLTAIMIFSMMPTAVMAEEPAAQVGDWIMAFAENGVSPDLATLADGTTIYYDNTTSGWSTVYVAYGDSQLTNPKYTQMTKGENNLWSAVIPDGNTQVLFADSINLNGSYYGPYALEEGKVYAPPVYTEVVAVIGSKEYTSLFAAVDAASSGATITMVGDSTEDSQIQISKDLTIDLAGHTVTMPGVFILNGNVTIENGTVIGSNNGYSPIQTYEVSMGCMKTQINLTLNDLNVTGLRHAVRIDGGDAVINGGEYRVINTGLTHYTLDVGDDRSDAISNVTVNGGSFYGPETGDGTALMVYSGSSVTVHDGHFEKLRALKGYVGGSLTVYGGTFDKDPSAYMAEDRMLVEENGFWTVRLPDIGDIFEANGLYYEITGDGAVSLIAPPDGTLYSGSVAVPETAAFMDATYAVTGIGDGAFDGCTELTAVSLMEGIRTIGNNAFQNTTALTSISLPNGLHTIGANAFQYSAITSMIIPDSVTSMGKAALANMDSLTYVRIGASMNKWGDKLVKNNDLLETVVISEGVTRTGYQAFNNCPKLSSVTLPSTMKTIGDGCFRYSYALESIRLPDGLTTIGSDAFSNTGLTSVTIPDSVTTLGSAAFQQNDKLTEVKGGAGLTALPYAVFRTCTALKQFILPENVTSIGQCAFEDSGLTSVTIPASVSIDGTVAFGNCVNLKSVTLEEGFNTTAQYMFQGCTALEAVSLPASLTTVPESMFNGCTSLKTITLAEGITTLNIGAFGNCTALETATMPASLTRIRHAAFGGNSSLTALYYEGAMPVVEHDNAFTGVSGDFVHYYKPEYAHTWTATLANYPTARNAAEIPVAKIGDTTYKTLAEALKAANDAGTATVTLLQDITLGEKLTVTGDVTITGPYVITRDSAYLGSLFLVGKTGTLTLEGGMTLDGGNTWIFDEEGFLAALASSSKHRNFDFVTSAENAPIATADLISLSGSLVINDATIQNHMGNSDCNVIGAAANSSTTLNNGAVIAHNASPYESTVIALEAGSSLTINDGALITGNYAGRNGGVSRNNNGTITMNGGSIKSNYAVNTNGTVFMLYGASSLLEMNGGEICSNLGVNGPNNSRNSAIYGHTGSRFVMNGGSICHNEGTLYGGVDAPYTGVSGDGSSFTFNGGNVLNNVSVSGTADPDLNGGSSMVVNGGTFSQDVTEWLSSDLGLTFDETTGTYVTTEHIYNLYFRDPRTGEQVSGVGPLQGNNPASLVATGKLFYADYYDMELEVLTDARFDETIVVDYPLSIDLNGKVWKAVGDNVTPAIRILGGADVTISGGTLESDSYCFILGASDGSSAGNLTIENGTYSGVTSVASVTKGMLTVKDGKFDVEPYEGSYTYLLNCIDANYQSGEAKISVEGGSFHQFDPANNAAEGPNTSFCDRDHISEAQADGYYTVRKGSFVAQVGDVRYESLRDALLSCTEGETVQLIADITYDTDDIVYAHGGATGFGNYDLHNPSIIYIGGTKGVTEAENMPSNVNAVLDLNGHTITSNAYAYLFLIMDNARLTFRDSVGTGAVISTTQTPVIWVTGAETLVTIDSGEYVTASSEGLLWSTHSGDLVIHGGEFRTTAEDASLLIMRNSQKFNNPNYFLSGSATVTVTSGVFHGFNPEKMYDDVKTPFVEFDGCGEGYKAEANSDGTYGVIPHMIFELHLTDANGDAHWLSPMTGNSIHDILEKGKIWYDSLQGTYDFTLKILEDCTVRETVMVDFPVTVDLGGHTISAANTLQNAPVLRVLSDVTVTNGTVDGTTGINSYAFIVGSHDTAGTLYIADGTYKGITSAISVTNGTANLSGGTYATAHDGEGTDYGAQYLLNCMDAAYQAGTAKFNITGGTFVGFNPEDNAAEGAGTDFVAEGYITTKNDNNVWFVEEVSLFDIDGANMTLGNSLAINFFIKPSDLAEDETYYALISKEYADGRANVVVKVEQADWLYHQGYKEYYVTFDKVAAKEMTDELTVVIYNSKNEQVSNIWTDSVRNYAMRMLLKEEKKSSPNAEQLSLFVDMLNYGAAAQEYFNDYHIDDPANSQLTAEQQAYSTNEVTMYDNRVKGEGYTASNLTLESEITMRGPDSK